MARGRHVPVLVPPEVDVSCLENESSEIACVVHKNNISLPSWPRGPLRIHSSSAINGESSFPLAVSIYE